MRTYPWIPPQYWFFLRNCNTAVCAILQYVQYRSMCNTRPYASMCNACNTLTYCVPWGGPMSTHPPRYTPGHPEVSAEVSAPLPF